MARCMALHHLIPLSLCLEIDLGMLMADLVQLWI